MTANSNDIKSAKDWLPRGALIEFLVTVALLEVAIWTVSIGVRLVAGVLAAGMICRCYLCYAASDQFKQLTADSRSQSARRREIAGSTVIIFSVVASFVVCSIAFLLDLWTPNLNSVSQRSTLDWLTVKIPTVAVQQLLFQLVLVPTLFVATRSFGWTLFGSALAFSLLHFPNPLLMLLTFSIGLIWFSLVIYRPRLISIVTSHLLLAVVVANVAEEYVLDMRVGQICFQKWPQRMIGQTDHQSITVYPRAVTGEIREVTQVGEQLMLSGNVYDFARSKSPKTVFVVFGSFDPEDETGESWSPQRIQSTTVDENGNFRLQFVSHAKSAKREIRLFVRHSYGWCYPVNDSARLDLLGEDPSGELICLYPREYHGNIGHVRIRNKHTDLIGWGFSMKNRKLIDSLLVWQNEQFEKLELSRRQRTEIARYYGDKSLLKCGFVSRVSGTLSSKPVCVYVRNSRNQLERLPVELANQRPQRLTQNQPGRWK